MPEAYSKSFNLEPWDSPQGWNWAIDEWPYLVRRINEYAPGQQIESIVLKRGLFALWFDKQADGSFLARYGTNIDNSLEYLSAEGIYRYTYISNGGIEITDFQDFEQTETFGGLFKGQVDADGFETVATGYTETGINAVETIRMDTTFRMRYDYYSGPWNGKIAGVELESEQNGVVTPIRRVRYLYYDGSTNEGLEGDLKASIIQQPVSDSDPLAWEDISVRYYRYTADDRHLLTTVVGPTVYMKLKEFGQDVLTMPQSSGGPDLVPNFANNLFSYDEANRVIREVARGVTQSTGPDGLTYLRERNPSVPHNHHTPRTAAEYNTWAWKITEEGFQGYRQIFYTNKIGQALAQIRQSLADPTRQWIQAWRLDGEANIIFEASPSAVVALDESLPDLIGYQEGDGSFANLKANEGLITLTEYYDETTATSTAPGGVKGYEKSTFIQRGWQGTRVPQSAKTWLASDNTSGPVTYVPAEETTFRTEEDSPASRIVISHAYTWYPPANGKPVRIQEKVTTFPAVPEDEGGDNEAHNRRELFDEFGNLIWEMDERGVITHREYDISRSLLTREVRDSDSAPSGWNLLPGTHLALVSDFSYDLLGRPILALGPEHEAVVNGEAAALRRAAFNCYVDSALSGQALFGNPVWNQIRNASGYRLSSSQEDTVIDPVTIQMRDKCGRLVHSIASKRTTGSGALAPSDTFLRNDWSRWQANFYEYRGMISARRSYYLIPPATSGLEGVFDNLGVEGQNYDESLFGYAEKSPLLIRRRDPEGTVNRFLYDDIVRLSATFVGLNDTPAGTAWEAWEPDNTGSDLVLTSTQEYDSGQSGGDSLVTLGTQYVSGDTVRQTRFGYDFRGRQINEQGEESRYVETRYDNLDQITETRYRNGNASGRLMAQEQSFYNALGRVYGVHIYNVDQTTGIAGDFFTGSSKYDPIGNLIEATEPGQGGLTTWRSFDNISREFSKVAGCLLDIAGNDTIVGVDTLDTTFDAASNPIAVQLGQLNAGADPSSPTYRVSYSQSWFDPLGRDIASATLGALPTQPNRPPVPPEGTDEILLNQSIYNERGELASQIDPIGRENQYAYDDKGRRIQVIENHVAQGNPEDTGSNFTKRFAYTADNQVRELTVVNIEQTTRWEFGVTLVDSLIASGKLVARKIYSDGSVDTYAYNRQGENILQTNANGTVHRLVFDGLGRLQHDCAFSLGSQIFSPVRRQTHFYNHLDWLASAQAHSNSDPNIRAIVNEAASVYDGFGSVLRQIQEHNGAAVFSGENASFAVSYTRNGGSDNHNRITSIKYPSGKEFLLDYGAVGSIDDKLCRVVSVKEIQSTGEQTLVGYAYLGISILVRKEYPEPEMNLDLWGGMAGQYSGLDRFGRIISHRWQGQAGDAAWLQYGYDRASRRTWRLDAVAESLIKNLDEIYSHDGLSQVVSLQRGLLNAARTGLESGSENLQETWQYDGIGNWSHYNQQGGTSNINQQRGHNAVNEVVRFQGTAWPKPRYDGSGNTTRLPGNYDVSKPFRVDYDAWNRISRIATFDAAWNRRRVSSHIYDALGWRIQSGIYFEEAEDTSKLLESRDYYYDENWRCVEEWTTKAPTPPQGETGWIYYQPEFKQLLLWDQVEYLYQDSLVLRDRDTDDDGQSDERLYCLQDAHFNTVAITDPSGAVIERYNYQAFGAATYLGADFAPLPASSKDWNILFVAYAHDSWIGLYYVRNRYYHSALGRWITRDPAGEAAGVNLYCFIQNNPVDLLEFTGLAKVKKHAWAITPQQAMSGIWGWTDYESDSEKPAKLKMNKKKCCCEVKKKPEMTFTISVQTARSGRQSWSEPVQFDGIYYPNAPVYVGSSLASFSRRHEDRRFQAWKKALTSYWQKNYEDPAKDKTADTCEDLQDQLDDLKNQAQKGFEGSPEGQELIYTLLMIGGERASVSRLERKSGLGSVSVLYTL